MTCKRQEISDRIDAMIQADRFPNALTPDYLSQAMVSYPDRGGKRLRPALLIWCCQAAGGRVEEAWNAALAVELFHNWTLIHDDIIDDDDTRRGRPTCHRMLQSASSVLGHGPAHRRKTFGSSMAILAGDTLHAWSVEAMARCVDDGVSPELGIQLVRRMCNWLTPKLISGEALDVEFELRPDAASAEIREMMYLKTGVLLQFCAETGVMIGKRTGELLDRQVMDAGRFAALAGIAFQMQDDILGVFANEQELGKPVGSDIAEGKRTMLIAKSMEMADEEGRAVIASLMGKGAGLSRQQLHTCQEVISRCGAREWLAKQARKTAGEAEHLLKNCFPASEVRENLEEWLSFLTDRSY